ncbi:MAG: hypothetical protein MJA32_04240, partial [Proteobacteria bacterium]|nr:hypothetical protein [Pseudomonadota bacterium]
MLKMLADEVKFDEPLRLIAIPEELTLARESYALDLRTALKELEKAALNDNGDAAAAIAHMYLNKSIVTHQRIACAEEWAKRGMLCDSAYAHWVYAWVCTENGDMATCIHHLRIALSKGFAPAAYDLGKAYEIGWGVRSNIEESIRHFEVAKALGHFSAGLAILDTSLSSGSDLGRYIVARIKYPFVKAVWNLRVLCGK